MKEPLVPFFKVVLGSILINLFLHSVLGQHQIILECIENVNAGSQGFGIGLVWS